jgi:PTH2 family peptidyl-tRNA hydrolase
MKQVILIRNDLKMPKGKLATQACHSSVEATLKSDKEKIKEWRMEGMKKVVLKVENEKEIIHYNQLAKDSGLTTALITVTRRSKRPGRKRAGSKTSGRLVAAMTTIPIFASKPSISTKI